MLIVDKNMPTLDSLQALAISPSDCVALMVFAFASLASLVGKKPIKTMTGAFIGLMLATIGIASNTGVIRFTFGVPDLLAGIPKKTVFCESIRAKA